MIVLVNAPVANGRLRQAGQREVLFGAMPEEEDLQVETPRPHVGVEVLQVRIIGHRLVGGVPFQRRAGLLGERSLPRPDIARDQHEMFGQLVTSTVLTLTREAG